MIQKQQSPLTPDEYKTFLRHDFSTFIERSFIELNPTTPFLPNWHIELIASELEACRRGQTTRLIINVPPRSLKSHCASIAFPAWLLGHNPSAQIICCSYAQDLANKLALDCRSLLHSDWYQQLFPTRLSTERQAVPEFHTTTKGVRLATSVGGVLTGRGADFLIIDDPLKPDEALSEAQRTAANEWFDHTLYSRLNCKRTGVIIVIMQRLHEDDLTGHLLAQDVPGPDALTDDMLQSGLPKDDVQKNAAWKLVRLPAIAEHDEQHTAHSVLGPRTFTRRAGEALHADREPTEVLEHLRRSQGEYNFAGQYQQSPSPLGGGLIKQHWFKSYTELPPSLRTHLPELGHGQQGQRTLRLQRLHHLGSEREETLPASRAAPSPGVPRTQTRRSRSGRTLRRQHRAHRRQGLRHAAYPGVAA